MSNSPITSARTAKIPKPLSHHDVAVGDVLNAPRPFAPGMGFEGTVLLISEASGTAMLTADGTDGGLPVVLRDCALVRRGSAQ